MIMCKENDYYYNNKCLFIEIADGVSQQRSGQSPSSLVCVQQSCPPTCVPNLQVLPTLLFKLLAKYVFSYKFSKIIFKC